MNKRTFLLDQRAAARIGRMLSSTPTSPQPSRGDDPTGVVMAKIEGHDGAGVYRAIEVFWNGSAWASNNCSRTWGAYYSRPGLRHVDADTSSATGTIVRAFLFNSNSSTPDAYWWFKEGGSGAYTGPFACTIAVNQTQIVIGATRAASAWAQDYILVHPDSILKVSQELVNVSASGVVYYEIKREDWEAVPISATAYFATTLPVSTSMYFMIPLAGVTFAGGIITGVRQLQYGNIIIDKTSADYCP